MPTRHGPCITTKLTFSEDQVRQLHTTNDKVLDRTKAIDIEIILIRNRLRCKGHNDIMQMPDERRVKAFLFGELKEGPRKVSWPLLKYKDTLKDILKRGGILNTWTDATEADRQTWCRLQRMSA